VNVGRAWKLQGDNSVDGREKEYMIEDQGLASGNSPGGASRLWLARRFEEGRRTSGVAEYWV